MSVGKAGSFDTFWLPGFHAIFHILGEFH